MISKLALSFFLASTASASLFEQAQTTNSAKAEMMSNMMRGARRLDGEEYEIDISPYYLKFEQCQFVKSYDDELAENEESDSVLGTKRFVIFKLCPSEDYCGTNYGEYIIDMETYLEATVQYQQQLQEEMCNECEENCQQDDGRRFLFRRLDIDCDECVDTCDKIENMEENGYIDATEFLECQQIQDADDDGNDGLFAGPYCSAGEKIKIGVFLDEECNTLDSSLDVETYLADDDGNQFKLSHALLSTTYQSTMISCLQVDENADDQQDDDKEPEVAEICQQIYEEAAKCEKTHGFDDGYANYDGYENQLANEEVVCSYISALKEGAYDEEGEIVVSSGTTFSDGGSGATGGQKFALTFFIIGTVGLAVYAAMLHSQLTKGAKADLSRQGGAMA